MRRRNPQRAARDALLQEQRDLYRWEFPMCQWYGCDQPAAELHEIARGPARRAALAARAAWLNLCRNCHQQYGLSHLVVLQLAVKKLADPEGYDRQAVNVLRGRQPEAITEAEVDSVLTKLLEGAT